jgi:histidinol-phosphate aminotransferase
MSMPWPSAAATAKRRSGGPEILAMSYERAALRRTAGYTPGRQPQDPNAIKLNTNENPYPPCEAVMGALAGVRPDSLRRYPPPLADAFRAVAARVHGVGVDDVIATNGGDELIRLAITTFVDPGRPIGILEPSYSLYPVLAEIHGSPLARVDLGPDWSIPEDAGRLFRQSEAQLIFVVNPHAPSGCLTRHTFLRGLARDAGCVVVVDEAYVDFVDPELSHDLVALVREFDNVLLLRSLSKGYSLAGLRFGYGIGHRELVAPMLTKTRDSYNVDAVAQALATAALEHREHARATWERVRADRASLRAALDALGLSSPPSQSNFLLASVPKGAPSAAELCSQLEARGVLVRHFPGERLGDALRITVGTPAQNARLIDELRTILAR